MIKRTINAWDNNSEFYHAFIKFNLYHEWPINVHRSVMNDNKT